MKITYATGFTLITAALVFSLGGCSKSDSQEEPDTDAAENRTIPVAVKPLDTGSAADVVETWGSIKPWQEADILAGVGGTVTRSTVRLGDAVQQGQVLLEIDPELYQARMDEAAARLEGAQVGLKTAQRNLERARQLREDEKISEVDMERATLDHANALATEAAARAGLAQAKMNLRDARPTAPFRARVANRVPDAGTSVNAAEPLVHLVDLDRVSITAEVSELDLARIKTGDRAAIRVEGLDRAFEGRVRGLGPQADSESRQFPVEIEVANPEHALRGGMIARVEIVLKQYDAVPMLPLESLVERNGALGFFVVQGGRAAWRRPVLGPRTKTHVALLEGGAARDSVVVMGQNRLQDGASVRVEPAP